MKKPLKLKQPEVQRDTVETAVQIKKKKKKKKKDMYAGLNKAVILTHTPKREVTLLKRESKNKKEKVVDSIPSAQLAVTPQQDQPTSRRRKRKGGENTDDLTILSMAGQKVQSTVRQQIKKMKCQIIASRKKHEEKILLDLENTAKKIKRCNALQNILAAASAVSQNARPTLKEFLASLN